MTPNNGFNAPNHYVVLGGSHTSRPKEFLSIGTFVIAKDCNFSLLCDKSMAAPGPSTKNNGVQNLPVESPVTPDKNPAETPIPTPTTSKKRLVICLDGTGNNIIATNQMPTNVVRFGRCVDDIGRDGVPQQVYYHHGIGTHLKWFGNNLVEQAMGKGEFASRLRSSDLN